MNQVYHRYHYYKQLAELDWDDTVSIAATKAKLASETSTKPKQES